MASHLHGYAGVAFNSEASSTEQRLHFTASARNFLSTTSLLRNNLELKVRASSVQQVANRENLVDIDPAFYEMGYVRQLRAYGIDFKESPDGVGVYAAKDFPYSQKSRIIMEIPLELMITVSKDPPWIFHPDYVPLGHPIFDIINSTEAEEDWDIRLACLLLFAMDTNQHFWQLYSDFLPEAAELTSLLLATEGEIAELQDAKLAEVVRCHQRRAESAWENHMGAEAPLKIRRLARTRDQFKWAVAIAQTRNITMEMTVGARPQVANMFIPYADMLNHSITPTCSYRWRRKDRMLEVLVNGGQSIEAGTEVYASRSVRTAMQEEWTNPFTVKRDGIHSQCGRILFWKGQATGTFNMELLEADNHSSSSSIHAVQNSQEKFGAGSIKGRVKLWLTHLRQQIMQSSVREKKHGWTWKEECRLLAISRRHLESSATSCAAWFHFIGSHYPYLFCLTLTISVKWVVSTTFASMAIMSFLVSTTSML